MLNNEHPLMKMSIEEMIEKSLLRFKKNGQVDGRCVAKRHNIVDQDGNDLRVTNKPKEVEDGTDDDVSDSESDDEFPPDTFFYGYLTEKVKDTDELVRIMSEGIKKYKDYMKTHENKEMLPEELVTTLDYWFQHDNERNDYFDYLISQESAPAVAFDKVSVRIIQTVEGQEQN